MHEQQCLRCMHCPLLPGTIPATSCAMHQGARAPLRRLRPRMHAYPSTAHALRGRGVAGHVRGSMGRGGVGGAGSCGRRGRSGGVDHPHRMEHSMEERGGRSRAGFRHKQRLPAVCLVLHLVEGSRLCGDGMAAGGNPGLGPGWARTGAEGGRGRALCCSPRSKGGYDRGSNTGLCGTLGQPPLAAWRGSPAALEESWKLLRIFRQSSLPTAYHRQTRAQTQRRTRRKTRCARTKWRSPGGCGTRRSGG